MLLSLLVACAGNTPIYTGAPVWKTFPFDGLREWEFTNTDTTLPYKLIASSDQEPEFRDGANLYLVDYWTRCLGTDPNCVDGESLRTIQWSSDTQSGTFIHGYSVGSGAFADLDPPLQVTADVMDRDDVVETTTGGATWTSTFLGEEICPAQLADDWQCSVFEITTDTGDGYPLAGKYWQVMGTGFTAMEIATETGQWQLSSYACEGECDGEW